MGKLTPQAIKLYVINEGSHCPFCGSLNIEGEGHDYEGNMFFENVNCNACGEEWTDEYTLTGITEGGKVDFPVPQKELVEFLDKFGEREFYSTCTGKISGEFCYAEYDYSDDEDIMFKLFWGINDGVENTQHIEHFRISIEDFKNSRTFDEKYELCQS